jgi:MaoC like domain
MKRWSVVAQNLPEHASNPIHTDAGARAAGFERALVAGVTTYAYCLHPVIEQWGLDWVRSGSAEVRLRAPVFAGDLVELDGTDSTDETGNVTALTIAATTDRSRAELVQVRATPAIQRNEQPPVARSGEQLETVIIELAGEYGSTYASRAGDDQALLVDQHVVHPAVWPALANYVFHRQVARGSWIHTRSNIVHHDLAYDEEEATVETVIVDRFQRSGERAVAEVRISVGDRLVAILEHEAIVDLSSRQ